MRVFTPDEVATEAMQQIIRTFGNPDRVGQLAASLRAS